MNVHRVKPCAQNRLKLVRFLSLPLVKSFFPLPPTPIWFSTPDSTDGIRDAGGEAEAPGAGDSRVGLFPTLQPRRGFHHLPSNLHFRYSSLRRTCSGDECKDNRNLSFNRQHLLAGIQEERHAQGMWREQREATVLLAICGSVNWSLTLVSSL